MTFLFVVLFVVLIAVSYGLIALSRRGRLGRRGQRPVARNLGMLSGLVGQDPGKPSSRQPAPSRRGGYRDPVTRPTYGESQALQRMPGRGDTATLVDEEGALGYESRLVPAKTATADQQLGLTVIAVSSAAHLPQQDVYYVQRNVIALARSLRPVGVDQRAAALTLSAVMSSQLGRISDVPQALQDGVESANSVVRSISRRDPEYSDMVTTLDIAFLGSDGKRPSMHFAHIGNSSIWLLRAADPTIRMLSETHTDDNGSLLRAVGLSQEVLPQIDQVPVQPRDRIFLTSASADFSFTPQIMHAALAYAGEPLHDCAAALADSARSSGISPSITIVAAEVSKEAIFSGRYVNGPWLGGNSSTGSA